jgi:hypothetical protein
MSSEQNTYYMKIKYKDVFNSMSDMKWDANQL